MSEPRAHSVQCVSPAGLHRMAYVEWGDPDNPRVLMCVHGLTRTGRDFDVLASHLARHYRVVCPDIVGRGKSEWLRDPNWYIFPQYVADIVTLVARLGVDHLDFFGTSMGGLIGILLASMPGSPIGRLLINDVGPHIEPVSLLRLREHIGQRQRFETAQEGVDYIAQRSEGFGPHTEAQWRALNAPMLRRVDGGFELRSDPAIAQAFNQVSMAAALTGELALWQAFDAIQCPVLVAHGECSDLLSPFTVNEMVRRGQSVRSIDIPGVGHAPTFIDPLQIAEAERFFMA